MEENIIKLVDKIDIVKKEINSVSTLEQNQQNNTEVNSMDFNDIFINEDDVFECSVKYYKKENDIFVKDVSEIFEENEENIKIFKFSCKYPSLAEMEALLILISLKLNGQKTELQGSDFIFLQIARLKFLLRKWDAPFPIKDIDKINPLILKGMLNEVLKEIQYKGLI